DYYCETWDVRLRGRVF
nr:immunoglobulin light chain junction region [Macaca mulatta]